MSLFYYQLSFSWEYYDNLGSSQIGFEFEAGSDEDWGVAEMWSSGAVMSAETEIVYEQCPAKSNGSSFADA